MTRDEFIDGYLERAGSDWAQYRTEDGFHVPGTQPRHALPCACGEDICEGWAMISDAPREVLRAEDRAVSIVEKWPDVVWVLDERTTPEVWKAADILEKAGKIAGMRAYTGTVLYGPPSVIKMISEQRQRDREKGLHMNSEVQSIVEKLRRRAGIIDKHIAEINGSDGSPYDVFRKELREAADEIERLEAALQEAKSIIDRLCYFTYREPGNGPDWERIMHINIAIEAWRTALLTPREPT